MTDDKTRHAGMADDNGAIGNADDERLLMMLGEALGDKPGDEETQAAWRRFEARHGAVRRRGMALRRAAMVLSAAAAVAVVLWLWPWSKPDNRDGIIETFAMPSFRRRPYAPRTAAMWLCIRRQPRLRP